MVIAAADVRIEQVQVIDSNGFERNIVAWICGPERICADTIADLSNPEKATKMPKWVSDGLDALPPSRQFAWDGKPRSGGHPEVPVEAPTTVVPTKASDDDLPAFKAL